MSKPFFFLYQTTNNVNGKIYVGKHKTSNLNDGYIGSGKLLKLAIAKYGIENFSFQILKMFDSENDLNVAEAEIVTEEFCTNPNTYNLCRGGGGGFSYIHREGLKPSHKGVSDPNNIEKYRGVGWRKQQEIYAADPEYRKSVIAKRVSTFKENRKITGGTFKGKSHSEQTKAKMSASSKGTQLAEQNSQFGTMWITNGTENRKINKVDVVPEGWYKGRRIKIRGALDA
ncbi:Seg-like homing endonuclease protein [Rhizobium phage RHph_I1_18]|nr:Seg-like homing endonuclease protein [Rhizobium phage RHph_I1_18]